MDTKQIVEEDEGPTNPTDIVNGLIVWVFFRSVRSGTGREYEEDPETRIGLLF
jgi:hypothetical protein